MLAWTTPPEQLQPVRPVRAGWKRSPRPKDRHA
jgi:hypothetical protein